MFSTIFYKSWLFSTIVAAGTYSTLKKTFSEKELEQLVLGIYEKNKFKSSLFSSQQSETIFSNYVESLKLHTL